MTRDRRRLVVVAGSGRSGTSAMTGTLALLGLHVPKPEVPADHTNPRGFYEPQWAVNHHQQLLREAGVPLSDARPAAVADASRSAVDPAARRRRRQWLEEAFSVSPRLVLKDPRVSWFLPAWRESAREVGADVGVVVMLRHPAEVVLSKTTSYHRRPDGSRRAGDVGDVARLAGWVNVLLLVEQTTRPGRRVFVRYDDLLAGWRPVVDRVTGALELALPGRDDRSETAVDGFISPELRRTATGWADAEVPDRLRDLAEQTWRLLTGLGELGGFGGTPGADDDPASGFDGLRARYDEMYGEAEAIAGFSLRAARREGRARA